MNILLNNKREFYYIDNKYYDSCHTYYIKVNVTIFSYIYRIQHEMYKCNFFEEYANNLFSSLEPFYRNIGIKINTTIKNFKYYIKNRITYTHPMDKFGSALTALPSPTMIVESSYVYTPYIPITKNKSIDL